MLHGRDGPDGKAFRDPVTEQVECVKDPVAEPGFAGIEGSPVAGKLVECAQDVFDMAKLPKLKAVVVCRKGAWLSIGNFLRGVGVGVFTRPKESRYLKANLPGNRKWHWALLGVREEDPADALFCLKLAK